MLTICVRLQAGEETQRAEEQQLPLPRLADPQRERHGRLLQERHQHASPHRLPGRVAVAVNSRHLSSCKRDTNLFKPDKWKKTQAADVSSDKPILLSSSRDLISAILSRAWRRILQGTKRCVNKCNADPDRNDMNVSDDCLGPSGIFLQYFSRHLLFSFCTSSDHRISLIILHHVPRHLEPKDAELVAAHLHSASASALAVVYSPLSLVR